MMFTKLIKLDKLTHCYVCYFQSGSYLAVFVIGFLQPVCWPKIKL